MSTAVANTKAKPSPHEDGMESMQTTSVDLVASLLLALAIMIGLAVVMLGVIFYLKTLRPHDPIEIVLEEEKISGRGDHAAGFARDLEPPGSEEAEQLNEPSVEQSLQAVTETLSSISASLDTMESGAAASGQGSGKGDSRPPGPEGEGDDIIPKFERWELKFTARDARSYAQQLDFFGIELSAVGGGKTEVDYAKNLGGTPQKRSGPSDQEKRLYFMNQNEGPLLKYEREFMTKAGVATSGRLILKMISKDLETQLATLEQQYAIKQTGKQVPAKELAKTVFDCQVGDNKGYVWVVVEQRYRVPKKK